MLEQPDLHFGTLWEMCPLFQEHHMVFDDSFADSHDRYSFCLQKS
jgi:hypothetical protein